MDKHLGRNFVCTNTTISLKSTCLNICAGTSSWGHTRCSCIHGAGSCCICSCTGSSRIHSAGSCCIRGGTGYCCVRSGTDPYCVRSGAGSSYIHDGGVCGGRRLLLRLRLQWWSFFFCLRRRGFCDFIYRPNAKLNNLQTLPQVVFPNDVSRTNSFESRSLLRNVQHNSINFLCLGQRTMPPSRFRQTCYIVGLCLDLSTHNPSRIHWLWSWHHEKSGIIVYAQGDFFSKNTFFTQLTNYFKAKLFCCLPRASGIKCFRYRWTGLSDWICLVAAAFRVIPILNLLSIDNSQRL